MTMLTLMMTGVHKRPWIRWRIGIVATLLTICGSVPAFAHIGPPYPIMQDRKIGPFTVAVWSNPDVGTGSFFVIIDPPPGGSVPTDMKVQVAVQPGKQAAQ